MKDTMTVAVEGSSELTLNLPHNDKWRMMNYAETYLASCYAIWVASNEDKDERAIAVRDTIMSLTRSMMDEVDECGTIH